MTVWRCVRSLLLWLTIMGPVLAETPIYHVAVVHSFPHDPGAYTEGLFYADGDLYESTGEVGQSTIRRVRLSDGAVLQSVALPPKLFGEGIVAWKNHIISVTWTEGLGFVWDKETLRQVGSFRYPGEGWALTTDGQQLYLSDGTPQLRILDPETFTELRRVTVTADGRPLAKLNELEWIKGEIWANVWLTPLIARIDPSSGVVLGWINLSDLPEIGTMAQRDDVLNGIAYDARGDRIFVTGKHWPHLYEIRLIPMSGG